jgi:NADH:ubiquinone oxidoreductase subunit K
MIKLLSYIITIATVSAGLASFSKIRNHIVSTLISLEFASLSTYLFIFLLLSNSPQDLFITLVYLALAACEGALGLSILVAVINSRGNDIIKSSNIIQC